MKQFRKPFCHIFLRTPLSRYWCSQNLRSLQKLFFQICLNHRSLGYFLCTDKFSRKHYGFIMQGKWDITSNTKCYDVITGRDRKKFFSKYYHIIYQRSFITDHSLLKGYNQFGNKWFGNKYDTFKIFKTGNLQYLHLFQNAVPKLMLNCSKQNRLF